MKKFIALVFVATALIFGCSNTDNASEKWLAASFLQNKTSQEEEIFINLKDCNQASRGLFPETDDIGNFNDIVDQIEWSLYFSPSTSNTYAEANHFSSGKINSSNGKISFMAIKKGIYDIYLRGIYQKDSNSSYEFSGSVTNVDLKGKKEIELEVSLVEYGTGSYSFTLEFDNNWDLDQITEDNVSIKVQPFSYYSPTDEELQQYQPEEINFTSETDPDSDEKQKVIFTAKKAQMYSGFYQIVVSLNNYKGGNFNNALNMEKLVLSDSVMSVSANKETKGTISAYYTFQLDDISPVYYATSDESAKGNGLYSATRGYVWDIISTIANADWTSAEELTEPIKIYCEDFMLDVSNYNTLLKSGGVFAKDITFNGSIQIIAENAEYLLSPDFVILQGGAIKLNSSQVNNSSSVPTYTDLTIDYLSDAETCLFTNHTNVTTADFFADKLYFETPSDYLTSDKPFIKITKAAVDKANESLEPAQRIKYFSDIDADGNYTNLPSVSDLEIYIYDETKKLYSKNYSYTADFALSEDKETYKIYLKYSENPNLNGELNVKIDSDINLVARYNGNELTDESVELLDKTEGAEITYTCVDSDGNPLSADEVSSYEWYINGTKIDESNSSISFDPYTQKLIKLSEKNYVECVVSYSTSNNKKLSCIKGYIFSFTDTFDRSYIMFPVKTTSTTLHQYNRTHKLDETVISNLSVFAVDPTTDDIYVVVNNDGYILNRFKYTSTGPYELDTEHTISLTANDYSSMTVGPDGKIWIAGVSSSVNYIYAYSFDTDSGFTKLYELSGPTDATSSSITAMAAKTVTTSDDLSYITSDYLVLKYSNSDNNCLISAYKVDSDVDPDSKVLTAVGLPVTVNTIRNGCAYVNDMSFVKISNTNSNDYTQKLFVVLTSSDRTENSEPIVGNNIYYRGAVVLGDIKIDAAANKPGVSFDSETFGLIDPESSYATWSIKAVDDYTAYFPYGDQETNCFFNPTKILAIKDDVVYIADDGVYQKEDSDVKCITNKDRIMEFNLKNKTLSVYAEGLYMKVPSSGTMSSCKIEK